MKVLFVSNFKAPDYQNDVVYHGLIDSGLDVYESAYPHYMLNTYPNPAALYGRGFSVFAKLGHTPKVQSQQQILDGVQSRFYDLVIYGSIRRSSAYLKLVHKFYPQSRIHLIDGEDKAGCVLELCEYGTYWKRESSGGKVNAISFAIPESQLLRTTPIKEKLFGHVVPGDSSTYIFLDEQSYYEDYAKSYYGKTWKKAGWDCMRHYEILANRCIPYFPDLPQCPPNTLVGFPKEIILETNNFAAKERVHPNYDRLNDELFEYTKSHLTTKQLIKRLLC